MPLLRAPTKLSPEFLVGVHSIEQFVEERFAQMVGFHVAPFTERHEITRCVVVRVPIDMMYV